MADVTQTLGFDASQAVASLEQLSFTINTVNQSIEKLQGRAKGDPTASMRQGALATEKTLLRLTRNVEHMRREFVAAGNAGKKAGDQITVSWNTVLRVLQTQVLLRGLNELQRQFGETADAAREFELQIARITTIAGDEISAGADELTLSIRNLAIELGRPLDDVASAAFQTLQNDVGNVGESLEFLRNASKLATVQGSELETAMNALTSVFKVYGAEAGNAADAADTFFVAVDKGRITINELADRLGTVIGPAEQIGLTFDQVAAAAASLTQTGLDTATATTQLRNIVLKLVKPTEDLQKAFKSLGVTTANELIARNNGQLLPSLRDLQEALGGTEEAVAKAFGTFRGQLGVFNLLTQEGALFQSILDAFPDKAGKLTEAFGKVEQTNARTFEKELAKLNDTLVTLGETTSGLELGALTLFNDVVPDAQALTAVLAGFGVTAVAAFSQSALAARGLQVALAGLTPAGLALAAAVGAATVAVVSLLPDVNSEIQETSRELAKSISEIDSGENERVKAIQNTTKEIGKALDDQQSKYSAFFSEIDSLYQQDQQNFEDSADRIGETGRRLVQDFIESREELLDRVDDALKEVDDRIQDSVGRFRDTAQELDDLRFENSIRGLNELAQASATLARSQQTALEAQRAFQAAGTDEEALKVARELQRLAERQAQDAVRLADRTENTTTAAQARANQERILTQALNAEQSQINQLSQLDRSRLGTQRDALALLIEQEKTLAEQVKQLTSATDAEGQRKNEQQILEDQKALLDVEKERQKVRSQIQASPVIEAFDLEKLEAETSAAFERGLQQIQLDTTAAVAQLEQAITEKTFGINLQIIDPELLTKQVQDIFADTQGLTLGERLSTRQDLLQGFVDAQAKASETAVKAEERFNAAAGALNKFVQDAGAGRPLLTNFELGLRQIDATLSKLTGVGSDAAQKALDQVLGQDVGTQVGQELVDIFNNLRTQGGPAVDATNQKIEELRTRLTNLQTAGQLTEGQVKALTQGLVQLETASKAIGERSAALEIIDKDAAREALVVLQNQGQTYDNLRQQIAQAKTSQEGVESSVKTTNTVLPTTLNYWNQIASAIQRAALASQQIQTPSGAAAAAQFFGGSVVHRATGGDLTRGQDQTLVAAQAGEFVVNARDSARFFAQLRAMNSGRTPIFREQGGPVTNVGDINVNVDARNATTVDGRQIARQLKRELRRGSSTL